MRVRAGYAVSLSDGIVQVGEAALRETLPTLSGSGALAGGLLQGEVDDLLLPAGGARAQPGGGKLDDEVVLFLQERGAVEGLSADGAAIDVEGRGAGGFGERFDVELYGLGAVAVGADEGALGEVLDADAVLDGWGFGHGGPPVAWLVGVRERWFSLPVLRGGRWVGA